MKDRAADFYDHFNLYADRPDVGFFVEEAKAGGGPVLELGCGTGRVLLPVARAGVAITGLDASPSMLAFCRTKLADEPDDVRARVTLVDGDMRDFDLGRRFRMVTIPFRPFQALTSVDEQLACLACIRRHLEPEGRLILDIFNPYLEVLVDESRAEPRVIGDPMDLPDGRHVVRRERIAERDRFAQVNVIELIYDVTHPDGRTERVVDRFPMRYLFRYEAEHLLVRAGFRVVALYADYERRPFGAEYPGELVFIARPAPR